MTRNIYLFAEILYELCILLHSEYLLDVKYFINVIQVNNCFGGS